MTELPPPNEKEDAGSQANQEQQYLRKVGWRALFGFSTRKHLPILSLGLFAATLAAVSIPAFAVIYGRIFREYTNYGTGKIESDAFLRSVTTYCLVLIGAASLSWIANSFYFFFFLTFGELQARSARNKIFDTLIRKDMTWFDTRETGIAAFLPGIQM